MNQKNASLIWLTGLSGSGKTTLGQELNRWLSGQALASNFLDADQIRQGLNRDLGFSPADRKENIRRIGEVAKILVDAGLITIAAFISPYREDRRKVRSLFPPEKFIEVYLECPLAVCEARDPKGLYRKARRGEIAEFTGLTAPYETPEHPELILQTDRLDVAQSVQKIVDYLKGKNLL